MTYLKGKEGDTEGEEEVRKGGEEEADEGGVIDESLPALPQPPQSGSSMFSHCRLLLSHLGFLSDENRPKLRFLENSKRFQRSLKELDKVNGRDVAKIGLIYVKEGQQDQSDILKNDTKSADYANFVRGLGWTVSVRTHKGFIGGLDRTSGSTGETTPYWASATSEAIFHDVTRMPTKHEDPQQIHKKRHVGNDSVHIIWTEHIRDYDPGTISSQFNDVHIVIYPICNGLYRIQIFRKESELSFGPVQDGMVLSKALLAPLIRATSINANRAVRALKKEIKRPFPTRALLIREMYDRYKTERSFEDYFGPFFRIAPPPGASPATSRTTNEDDASQDS